MKNYNYLSNITQAEIIEDYNKNMSHLNNDDYNVLLFGMYPSSGDMTFRLNKQLIDTKQLFSSFNESNKNITYSFMSNYKPTIPDGTVYPNYTTLYIDCNNSLFTDSIMSIDKLAIYDLIYIDACTLKHIENGAPQPYKFSLSYDIHYTLFTLLTLIKPNGKILFRKNDKQYVHLFDWNMYCNWKIHNLDNLTDCNKDINIIDDLYDDPIETIITILEC